MAVVTKDDVELARRNGDEQGDSVRGKLVATYLFIGCFEPQMGTGNFVRDCSQAFEIW